METEWSVGWEGRQEYRADPGTCVRNPQPMGVKEESVIGCQVLLMVKGEGAQERWLGLVTRSWRPGQERFGLGAMQKPD